MNRPVRQIVIDARPRGPSGPWAWQHVGESTSLARLVRFLSDHDRGEIRIHGAYEDTPRHLDIAAAEAPAERGLRVTSEDPPEDATVLRTDRVYDPDRLMAALAGGKGPETAVVWRLDVKSDLTSAADELKRRTEYQPIGRFWAWSPAKQLVLRLSTTQVRPNHVTLAAAACFLLACLLVAWGEMRWWCDAIAASLLAAALVLDTADGHLARVQRTASEFGRWLDTVLDELCDVALHAAIAWAAFAQSHNEGWLLLGMAYLAAKYLFFVAKGDGGDGSGRDEAVEGNERPNGLRRIVRALAHADVRWHVWIALAAVGYLRWELLAYTLYYLLRAAAVGRKWIGR